MTITSHPAPLPAGSGARPGRRRGLFVVALLAVLSAVALPARPAAADVAPVGPAEAIVVLVPGAVVADVAARNNAVVVDTIAGPPLRYLLRSLDARTTDQFTAALALDPAVGHVWANSSISSPEVTGTIRFFGWAASPPTEATTQYATSLLGLDAAHRLSTGAGVTVAVVDTGVQLAPNPHPALAAALVPGIDLVDGDDVPDDAATGVVDAATGVADPMTGHGTHVAGIVHLVAPDARIMPVRVLDSAGVGTVWNVVKGIEWAAEHGATVVNASFGGRGSAGLMKDEVAQMAARGVTVVAAAGNDGRDRDNFPAATRCAVSVTASDADDAIADFSTTGKSVSVAAPGVSITSTHPASPTGYAAWSGSSMAAPFASGTTALIEAVRPSTPGEVLALVAGTAKPVTSTFGKVYFGRLDPTAAVEHAIAGTIPTAAQARIPERCLP